MLKLLFTTLNSLHLRRFSRSWCPVQRRISMINQGAVLLKQTLQLSMASLLIASVIGVQIDLGNTDAQEERAELFGGHYDIVSVWSLLIISGSRGRPPGDIQSEAESAY